MAECPSSETQLYTYTTYTTQSDARKRKIKKKSLVWTVFHVVEGEPDRVQCKLCDIKLVFTGSSTSSMNNHIRCIHKELNAAIRPNDKGRPGRPYKVKDIKRPNITITKPRNTHYKDKVVQIAKTKPNSDGCPITEQITRYVKHHVDEKCERDITKKAAKKAAMICIEDVRPLLFLDGVGFRKFCAELNPDYKIPSQALVRKCVDTMYRECKVKTITSMATVDVPVSLTVDTWSSNPVHNYVTITGHYISSDWELQSKLLTTRMVDITLVTEGSMASLLNTVQNEFHICEVSGLTAKCSNNLRLTGYPYVQCFADTLNKAVNDGLRQPTILNVTVCARKLFAFLNTSTAAKNVIALHRECLDLSEEVSLSCEDDTEWTTIYNMYNNLTKLRGCIHAVLHGASALIACTDTQYVDMDVSQWELMEHLVPVLKPLASAAKMLCLQEFGSCSGIIPLAMGLVKNHLAVENGNLSVVKHFKSLVTQSLRNFVFPDEFWLSLPMIATALDPRYKKLKFLSESQRDQVADKIKTLMHAKKPLEEDPTREKGHTNATTDNGSVSLMNYLMGDIIDAEDVVQDDEYSAYVSSAMASRNQCHPLKWWAENASRFPNLAKLAKCFLPVSSTSFHTFSATERSVSKQRSALEPDMVDKILFLNKNLSLDDYHSEIEHNDHIVLPSSTGDTQAATNVAVATSTSATSIPNRNMNMGLLHVKAEPLLEHDYGKNADEYCGTEMEVHTTNEESELAVSYMPTCIYMTSST